MSKKGKNIYKRKDGRWEARYIKARTPEGRAKYGYCYAKTYREVSEKLERAKVNMLTQPTAESSGKKQFSAYCSEWLALRRGRVKDSTYDKYRTVIELHIIPSLGRYRPDSLTNPIIGQFGSSLTTGEGLSSKTVRDILSVLSAILKYASKEHPRLDKIDIIYPKEEKHSIRVLTRQEQTRLVEYLLSDDDLCKFGTLLVLLTGLRIGELCALRWENISLCERTLTVTATMQRISADGSGGKTKVVISDPKSSSSARTIPLGKLAYSLCRKYKSTDGKAFILTGRRDKFIEPRTLQYRMAGYTKACGLSGVHFHTLRHSFATRCVEVGVEIKSLSEVLGHSSPRITLERYVHSSMDLKRENMKKLSALGY